MAPPPAGPARNGLFIYALDAARLAVFYEALLGLAQVLLYAGMAGDDGRLGVVAWVACVALTALVVGWQHAHAWRILAVALVASAGVVGVGLLDVLRRAPAPLDGQRR